MLYLFIYTLGDNDDIQINNKVCCLNSEYTSIVSDSDECSTGNPCASSLNTECVDTVGSHICKCKDGFTRSSSSGPCAGNVFFMLMTELNIIGLRRHILQMN